MKKIIKDINRKLLEAALVKHSLRIRVPEIARITLKLIQTLRQSKTVYLFGNGGSATDAQHIAAELVGRFEAHRKRPLPAIALTTNTSLLTSIGNDYGFEEIFSRQVEALVERGDVVIAISTSGNSPNILRATRRARQLGAYTIGFTGQSGGRLKRLVHLCLCVPSRITARIQECHITAGHIICELIEAEFLKR